VRYFKKSVARCDSSGSDLKRVELSEAEFVSERSPAFPTAFTIAQQSRKSLLLPLVTDVENPASGAPANSQQVGE
jgi:hypothetical protein